MATTHLTLVRVLRQSLGARKCGNGGARGICISYNAAGLPHASDYPELRTIRVTRDLEESSRPASCWWSVARTIGIHPVVLNSIAACRSLIRPYFPCGK